MAGSLYERSLMGANDFAGGTYAELDDHALRGEWWGFKNGYVRGYRAAQAEMRKALGVER